MRRWEVRLFFVAMPQIKKCSQVSFLQNFRGVPCATLQDDEAAFGEMDVQGKGLVDLHELPDALRVMGKSERDVLQLLKELVCRLVLEHPGSMEFLCSTVLLYIVEHHKIPRLRHPR